ncbi:MAG: hypothetical protein DWQ10_07695 [Calditrichaeota bacterium]|nr:MAG: hypothetical protein DWQ10_07695 [Calditrichota bacterium]
MQLSRHLDKGFWAVAANIAKALYGFGVVFWLIAVLPKEAYANYLLVQTTYLIIAQLLVSMSLAAYIKFYYEQSDLLELQSAAVLIFVVASVLVFLVFIPLIPLVSVPFKMHNERALFLFVPGLFFASAIKLFTNEVFKATHKIKAIFISEVTFFIMHSLLVIGLYFYAGLNSATDVLYPAIFAYVIASVVGLWLARHNLIYSFKFSLARLKETVRFNRFVFAIGVSNNIFEHVDTYIVAALLNKPALALFGVLKLFTRIFIMFRQVVGTIGFPAFARLHSEGRPRDLRSLYEKGIYYASIVLSVAVLAIVLSANFIFDSILTKYAGNGFYLQIFILSGLFIGWQTIGDNLLFGIGKPRIVFYNRVVVSGLNVAMNVMLISRYGITGAVITANITMFLLMLLTTYFVRRNINFTFAGIWGKRYDAYYFLKSYSKSGLAQWQRKETKAKHK